MSINYTFKKSENMVLHILPDKRVSDIQGDISKAYPYLKLDFYKTQEPGFSRKHINPSYLLKAAGLRKEGDLTITDQMTVGQLENAFRGLGLQVQVSRKSGGVWLETTKSDSWTLKQQNDHGRELSEPVN